MADLTRPIIGIENRTAQEVFDIMCDRFRRASPSQVAPQPQAGEPVGGLYGPFGWLNGCRGLSEDSWELESDPLENSEEYFAVPLYALTDPLEVGPLYASPQPANQAQVTDADLRERLDEAEAIISERNDELALIDWISDKIGLPHDEELTRENFAQYLAAIGAGGQAVAWQPMDRAPKDGTMLRLLARPGNAEQDGWTPFTDSSDPYTTIGFNALSDTLVDEWQFVGWDWCHDCFIDGAGDVIGWLPFDALSQPHHADERVAEAANTVLKWLDGGCPSWGVPEQQIRILALSAKEGRKDV